jgi:hypothetical protein
LTACYRWIVLKKSAGNVVGLAAADPLFPYFNRETKIPSVVSEYEPIAHPLGMVGAE